MTEFVEWNNCDHFNNDKDAVCNTCGSSVIRDGDDNDSGEPFKIKCSCTPGEIKAASCPICKELHGLGAYGWISTGPAEWQFCSKCKVKWLAGYNLSDD